MVAAFGVGVLSDKMKTPEALHALYCYENHIDAVQELKQRVANGEMSQERLYKLLMAATENRDLAETEVAKYILNTTQKK